MNVWHVVAEAIHNQKQLIALYHGQRCEVCPHVLGFQIDVETRETRAQCLAFQFGGHAEPPIYELDDPRAIQNWRCFFLDELSEVQTRDGIWYSLSRRTIPRCVDDVQLIVAGWK